MFVVLKTVLPEKRYIERKKQAKRIRKAPALVCKTDRGLPFYVLEVLEEKNGIDWVLTSEKCGRYASRIIASHSIPLPDNSGLKRFIPISMNAILIFNTALKTIGQSDLPPEKTCITLTDRNAVMYQRVNELIPFASTVRVITSHPERFASASAEIYENYGASLVIRNTYEPVKHPEIVICCDGAVLTSMSDAAVFTAKRKSGGKIRFCGSGVELSDYHKSIISPDIETVDFAGALTELCGSSEYRASSFSKTEISCSECENPQAEKCLKCFIGKKV
ncbi:MAG: hypothetical protein IJZ07_07550 [Clostridia bacterium]|nr:hypothetical protein [Clostridia bacterium]